VECDVPRFVADDQVAHLPQRDVAPVPAEHLVINMADNLRAEQRTQFEPHPKHPPHSTEQGKAPVALDLLTSETSQQITQQA
jgi:hypothetical protein